MEVIPFQGIRYDQSVIGDIARVVCPPYDVITLEQQRLYYERSDYNAIRLEFPEPTSDRYQRAAITFQEWLEHGILRCDDVPSYYLHEHRFQYLGARKARRGLLARVRLEPWGSGIHPHEETSSRDKSDRLQLMQACRANFSPLFSLYHDSGRRVATVLSEACRARPVIETSVSSPSTGEGSGEGTEAHTLWAITDSGIKQELSQLLSSRPLYIADGHHRYETALNYQQERAQEKYVTGREAFNYVMMELLEFSDPGLVVLPLHRLVRNIPPSSLVGLVDRLRDFFAVEPVTSVTGRWDLPTDSCLGILGLQSGPLVVLKKRQDVSFEGMMPGNRSQAYRDFGVSILNHVILDKVLSGAEHMEVAYTADLREAQEQIREGEYQLAFLLQPPQPEILGAVADAQDRMPRKSTYFYPKLPTGLVINSLD